MSDEADSVEEAIKRVSERDSTLKWIYLEKLDLTDSQVEELFDCLIANPDVVECIYLTFNRLTDATGVKLARCIAASSCLEVLVLNHNRFGDETYLAIAHALRVNTSLKVLYLGPNPNVDHQRIDAAFVDAMWLNSSRPPLSEWHLYHTTRNIENDFRRLQKVVAHLGHPPLQMLLWDRV